MQLHGDDLEKTNNEIEGESKGGEDEEENDREEATDQIETIEEKSKKNLKYKRSFFVRMVSDPKIYNPKIVKMKELEAANGGAGTIEDETQRRKRANQA